MHRIWGFVSLLTFRRVAIRARSKAICLTFDDGPHPEHTPRLLDLLRQYSVQVTFFLQGRYVEKYPKVVTRIVAEGHRLGNHSLHHTSFVTMPLRAQVDEIRKTDALLAKFDHHTRHPFRPPNGRLTARLIAWCLLHGRRIVLWTHDSRDFCLSASEVLERVSRMTLRPGSIVLFHDDTAAGIGALERLIPQWQGEGVRFTTL